MELCRRPQKINPTSRLSYFMHNPKVDTVNDLSKELENRFSCTQETYRTMIYVIRVFVEQWGFCLADLANYESPTKTRFLAKIRYLRKIHVNKNNMLRRC